MRRAVAVLLLVLGAGCAGITMPVPPDELRQIAVLPSVNRTGRELVVSGDWWLERALGQPRMTVPEMLAGEAGAILAARGFRVVEPAAGAPSLRFDLQRWAPDPSGRLAFVGVDVRLDLLAADGARVVWSASRRRWLVPVRGAPSSAAAYERVARTIVETFLAGWRPAA